MSTLQDTGQVNLLLLKDDKDGKVFYYLHGCPKVCLKSQVWLEGEGGLDFPEQSLQQEFELQTCCDVLCWADIIDENTGFSGKVGSKDQKKPWVRKCINRRNEHLLLALWQTAPQRAPSSLLYPG